MLSPDREDDRCYLIHAPEPQWRVDGWMGEWVDGWMGGWVDDASENGCNFRAVQQRSDQPFSRLVSQQAATVE
jgi:hypothetical protein